MSKLEYQARLASRANSACQGFELLWYYHTVSMSIYCVLDEYIKSLLVSTKGGFSYLTFIVQIEVEGSLGAYDRIDQLIELCSPGVTRTRFSLTAL